MNLTPEEKALGKENFLNAAINRRDFMKQSVIAGAVAGGSLGAFYFGYESTLTSPVRVGVIGTGDEGNVLIGAINPNFIKVKSIADIRPYSIYRAFHGDHYSPAAAKARPGLMKVYGWKTEEEARKHVEIYDHEKGGYERLLENAEEDDIEAVIIALPLHLHAKAAIAAMNAGLHVLTEKLMGHNVRECKEMALVAEDTKLYLATGHQRHYNLLYENAVDQIRRGLLGDLHYVRAQWHRRNMPDRDSWKQPMPEKVKPEDSLAKKLAEELKSWEKKLASVKKAKKKNQEEIELWTAKVAQKKAQISDELLGTKAKEFGYEDAVIEGKYRRPAYEELHRWRLWHRTGGGLMAELGSHQLDAAGIFIAAQHGGEKQFPLSVAAAANRPLFPVDRDVDDHVYCIVEFPAPGYYDKQGNVANQRKKIGVQYASINGNEFGGYGEIVFGTKRTLILEKELEGMLFDRDTKSKISVSAGSGPTLDTQATGEQAAAVGKMATGTGRGYREQLEHWAWCIRKDPDNSNPDIRPRCHPKVALADAVIALTTNIAARESRRIEFDKDWFDPKSDKTPENPENDPKLKPDVSRYNG